MRLQYLRRRGCEMEKKNYAVREDKCLIETMSKEEAQNIIASEIKKTTDELPKITSGTQVPPNSSGKDGDVFLLLES